MEPAQRGEQQPSYPQQGDERPVLQPADADGRMERATRRPDLPPFPWFRSCLIDVNATLKRDAVY